jgi:hypothetical protein
MTSLTSRVWCASETAQVPEVWTPRLNDTTECWERPICETAWDPEWSVAVYDACGCLLSWYCNIFTFEFIFICLYEQVRAKSFRSFHTLTFQFDKAYTFFIEPSRKMISILYWGLSLYIVIVMVHSGTICSNLSNNTILTEACRWTHDSLRCCVICI